MADETRIQVLHEEDRKATTDSFMWAFRSGEDGLTPIILYKYSQTRSGDVAKEFFILKMDVVVFQTMRQKET